MKLAIITDTHFGGRSDSAQFDQYFKRFYDEVFFPYLDKTQIKTVIHLGDVFDRRKYINFQILKSCREYFFDKLASREIDMLVIPGNHDTYYKNTNEVNSLNLLLGGYSNIELLEEPTERTFGSLKTLFVPWICAENYTECLIALATSNASVCMGHLEIEGFEMHRGMGNEGGMNAEAFNRFPMVLSGHFHHRSSSDVIHYLGSPYEMTWSDYDDPRGFHILDTETMELEFIENPFTIHRKILYNDSEKMNVNPADYVGAYVKIVVVSKKKYSEFDKLIDSLYINNVAELKILEDFSEFELNALDDSPVNLEDTMTLLSEYIDSFETDLDKSRLKTVMKALYVEAQNSDQ